MKKLIGLAILAILILPAATITARPFTITGPPCELVWNGQIRLSFPQLPTDPANGILFLAQNSKRGVSLALECEKKSYGARNFYFNCHLPKRADGCWIKTGMEIERIGVIANKPNCACPGSSQWPLIIRKIWLLWASVSGTPFGRYFRLS